MKVIIYTPKVTNRIKYIIKYVFEDIFCIDYKLKEEKPNELKTKNIYINYSNEYFDGYFNIPQHHLLLEDTITAQNICFEENNLLFPKQGYDIKFDIFSAIFYLISRYEEYLPHQQDEHKRYKAENSILFKNKLLQTPIVDIWINNFAEKLNILFPNFIYEKPKFQFLPTFDIDNAFKEKGRTAIGKLKAIFNNPKLLFTKKEDEYDTYNFILETLKQYKTNQTIFFFLVSNHHKNDSFVNKDSYVLKELIQQINSQPNIQIGIHPSYNSLENKSILDEKTTLENIVHNKVKISRQHYLKISFPMYYNELHKQKIKEDYSLAYPNIAGFRAATSRPFFWYNLAQEKQTDLLLYPTIWMDATYEYYNTKTENEIIEEAKEIINKIYINGGFFTPIFHNDLLSKINHQNIFIKIFEYIYNLKTQHKKEINEN